MPCAACHVRRCDVTSVADVGDALGPGGIVTKAIRKNRDKDVMRQQVCGDERTATWMRWRARRPRKCGLVVDVWRAAAVVATRDEQGLPRLSAQEASEEGRSLSGNRRGVSAAAMTSRRAGGCAGGWSWFDCTQERTKGAFFRTEPRAASVQTGLDPHHQGRLGGGCHQT